MRFPRGWMVASVLAGIAALMVAGPAFAQGGGVGGGGSFGGGGGGGGGGGFGGGLPFPMFFPFFGFGGGGIIPILLFLLVMWFMRQSQGARGGGLLAPARPSQVSLIRLEIGFLSTAKDIPVELHSLVDSVDTSNNYGLSTLLQQSALLLLRNQQYWHAASYTWHKVPFDQAESGFNSLTMDARAKLSYETITNVGGSKQVDTQHLPAPADQIAPGDYIVVVLIVATSAPVRLAPAQSPEQIREQLSEVAAAAGPNLEGVEVIWQPDSANEALSRDDLIRMYPELAPI